MENGPARSLVGGDEAVLLCGLVEAGVDGEEKKNSGGGGAALSALLREKTRKNQ